MAPSVLDGATDGECGLGARRESRAVPPFPYLAFQKKKFSPIFKITPEGKDEIARSKRFCLQFLHLVSSHFFISEQY
ncbi:hypothetical protein [Corynebacterium dentalis]|uniref:hypothetical protein n=1 Tax=Corynebacterium dentalis TaxID=2014528 RepID=UPI00289D1F31|nr:hypothetical protein [Corynebacterium dentalis]